MHGLGRKYRLLISLVASFIILAGSGCLPASLQMEFDVVASPSVFTGPGQVITYSYHLNNTNNVYFDFGITDDRLGAVACGSTRLEAGQSISCQLSYTTTEQDVSAGVIVNNASAHASYRRGDLGLPDQSVMATDSVEVVYELPPCQLDLEKSANKTTYLAAGEVIQYTYQIHNIGFAEVSGPFAVADDKVDDWSCDDEGIPFSLCVDCFISCHGSYTVKASDVGSNITNTAQAEGICDTTSQPVRSNAASATVLYLLPTSTSQAIQPQLTVTVSVNQTTYSRTRDVIVYTYKVQNTGQTAVNGPFELVDEKADQWECDSVDSLPVGSQLICKGYYRIRQDDLCASVTNVAHVKATFQSGTVTSNQASIAVHSGRNCRPHESENEPEQPAPSTTGTPGS